MCTENYHWHHDYVRLAWDSGFCFDVHKSKSNFDWSSIGLVDIERVSRDRDIAVVEKHITTILHFSLDDEQTKILDPTFVKVFRLSQLSVQYLQFCKRYLDNTVVLLKKQLAKQNEENINLREQSDELKLEIVDLKRKVKELKLSLQHQTVASDTGGNLKCSECSKVFLNEEFLSAHIKRRHPMKDINPLQKETDKLQLEIKELKERLNSTEKYVQGDHNLDTTQHKLLVLPNNDISAEGDVRVSLLHDKFEQLKDHVERELTLLRDQKQYHDKYEKWFELVFQRLDHSQKELLDKDDKTAKEENVISEGDKVNTKENFTQTAVQNINEIPNNDKKIPSQTAVEEAIVNNSKSDLKFVQKIQEDIRVNTESHLDQIQDILQQKLTGGLEQIQTQMNSFWQKINDLELQKAQQPQSLNISPEANTGSSSTNATEKTETPVAKPKPAPRIAKIPKIVQTKPKAAETKSSTESKQVYQTQYVTSEKEEDISSEEDEFSADMVSAAMRKLYEGKNKNINQEQVEINNKFAKKNVPILRSKTHDIMHNTKPSNRPKPEIKKVDRSLKQVKEYPVSESDSADIELQASAMRPQVQPSNTSTLAQRSLTSLKHALKDQDVQAGLREELQEVVNIRLKEIGVSPHWSSLPQKSYARALKIITHRAHLFAKKYPNYAVIHDEILANVDFQVGKVPTKMPKSKFTVKTHERNKPVKPIVHFSRKTHQKLKAKKPVEAYIMDFDDSNDQTSNFKTTCTRVIDIVSNSPDTNVLSKYPDRVTEKQEKISTPVKLQTPIKKKVLFDIETSSSNSVRNIGKIGVALSPQTDHQEPQEKNVTDFKTNLSIFHGNRPIVFDHEKENNPGITQCSSLNKTKQHVDFLVSSTRTAFEIKDTDSTTSVTSSVFDGSKTRLTVEDAQNVPKPKSTKDDDISDWDISDILT